MSWKETSLCLSISGNEASVYVWLENGVREEEPWFRIMWRFKFISPVKNNPFKDQMLHGRPSFYPNHLFVFIAFLLSRCQPARVNPIVLHLLEESFFEKLQVMLKQGQCHRLHKNTEIQTNKKCTTFWGSCK